MPTASRVRTVGAAGTRRRFAESPWERSDALTLAQRPERGPRRDREAKVGGHATATMGGGQDEPRRRSRHGRRGPCADRVCSAMSDQTPVPEDAALGIVLVLITFVVAVVTGAVIVAVLAGLLLVFIGLAFT
jgi:hypothetical protein